MHKKFFALLSVLACSTATLSACGEVSASGSDGESEEPSSTTSEGESVEEERNYTWEYYENAIYPRNTNGSLHMSETPDPSIVKGDDGYYYIFTTGSNGGKCFRSSDCVNWEVWLDPVIERPTWGDDYSSGNTPAVWAPDVAKVGDQWIYYYSLSGWDNPIGVGYATADSIAGPWTDQGKLFYGDEINLANAIDPCIFQEDGRVYMAVGSFQGIDLIELDETGTALLNGADYQRENKTLIAGTYGTWNAGGFEGSYIIKRGDYYYYFGSHGTCCNGSSSSYYVVAARSTSIDGPYYDADGMPITNNGYYGSTVVRVSLASDNIEVAGPGHNSVFQDDAGDWWLVYHAYVEADNFSVRHLMMDKLLWTEDGWPYVENYTPSYGEELEGPRILVEDDSAEATIKVDELEEEAI